MYNISTRCDSCISIARLIWALTCPFKLSEEMDEPKWMKDALIHIMTMLTENDDDKGLLTYQFLCREMGNKVIQSLIEYNIIHLRPSSVLAFDVPQHKYPVISAESPATRVAMQEILEQLEDLF